MRSESKVGSCAELCGAGIMPGDPGAGCDLFRGLSNPESTQESMLLSEELLLRERVIAKSMVAL